MESSVIPHFEDQLTSRVADIDIPGGRVARRSRSESVLAARHGGESEKEQS
jgi:hypothetical protein